MQWLEALWRPTEALHRAAEGNNVDLANAILTVWGTRQIESCVRLYGGEIRTRCLHRAAQHGSVDVARILLQAGADVEAMNERGMSSGCCPYWCNALLRRRWAVRRPRMLAQPLLALSSRLLYLPHLRLLRPGPTP